MYSHEALQQMFGDSYNNLTNTQKHLLQADVMALYDEDPEAYPLYVHAASELRRRIGGTVNLLSYAQTLEDGLRWGGHWSALLPGRPRDSRG
jgi:hypothetical protein